MALTYDFDIYRVSSEDLTESDERALFRDPAAAEAILGADAEVRAFFEASGFGFDVYDSGAGPGRFPPEDEPAINAVAGKLAANIKTFELKGRNFNGFDMAAFCRHLVEMKPAEAPASEPTGGSLAGSPIARIQQKHAAQLAAAREASLPTPDEPAPELHDPEIGLPEAEVVVATGKRVRGSPRSGLVAMGLVFGLLAVVGMGVGLEMIKPDETEVAGGGSGTAAEATFAKIKEIIEGVTSSAE